MIESSIKPEIIITKTKVALSSIYKIRAKAYSRG